MFFHKKITLIKEGDRVLEIGPGGTPHERADIFLEKSFDKEELQRQSGSKEPLKTDKKIVFYDGGTFPFEDNSFDYIICTHVLEHVPSDEVEYFIQEMVRVGKRGYIEYPSLYYDYIYNIREHLNLMNLDENNCILYMEKEQTHLKEFALVQKFFLSTLEHGYTTMVDDLQRYFFKGFEWEDEIMIKRVNELESLIVDSPIEKVKEDGSCMAKLKNRLKWIFKK